MLISIFANFQIQFFLPKTQRILALQFSIGPDPGLLIHAYTIVSQNRRPSHIYLALTNF